MTEFTLEGRNVVVTGGAGFIGSHLVDSLRMGNEVTVYDNFSSPAIEERRKDVDYVENDILNLDGLLQAFEDMDTLFHFAAAASVQESSNKPVRNFKQNVQGTVNVLEAARRNDVSTVVFASSSTVYGEAEIPTSEEAPIEPISNYGASKAACEMYLRSYSSTYGLQAISLRYANIFGPRSDHGVIYDFFQKLKRTPENLEILGDGTQNKSYLYVDDAVEASLASLKSNQPFDSFNIGSEDRITVSDIAEIVSDEMNFDPEYVYTGGKRGWKGDVTEMLLDVNKIKSLGWSPRVSVDNGIRRYVRWLENRHNNSK